MKSRWWLLVNITESARAKAATSHHWKALRPAGGRNPADSTADRRRARVRSSWAGAVRTWPRTSCDRGSENSASQWIAGRAVLIAAARKCDAANWALL